VFRNYDPGLRPQEKAVEYVRALNAVKLDKVRLYVFFFFCFQFRNQCVSIACEVYLFLIVCFLIYEGLDFCKTIYWRIRWTYRCYFVYGEEP